MARLGNLEGCEPGRTLTENIVPVAEVIDENRERLAQIEMLDNGKPIRESNRMRTYRAAADHFRYFCGCVFTEEGEAMMPDQNTLNLILQGAHWRSRADRSVELPVP